MLDKRNIILGFTGSIGSGCTYISKCMANLSIVGYCHFKLSDIIRNELIADGIKKPSVKQMQDKGNLLRSEHGQDILAATLMNSLSESSEAYKYIIVDGIKNDEEVVFLRQLPNFYLFSVNADREIRKKDL